MSFPRYAASKSLIVQTVCVIPLSIAGDNGSNCESGKSCRTRNRSDASNTLTEHYRVFWCLCGSQGLCGRCIFNTETRSAQRDKEKRCEQSKRSPKKGDLFTC